MLSLSKERYIFSHRTGLSAGWLLIVLSSLAGGAPLPGDADCDGSLTERDVAAVVAAIVSENSCSSADVNGDGVRTAADLPAEIALLAAPSATATPTPARAITPTATAGGSRFGVLISGQQVGASTIVNVVTELGAGWARVNQSLDGTTANDQNLSAFLDAGVNVVVTFNNRNPTNSDTTYGSPAAWPNAGFPFVSAPGYEQDIRDTLAAVAPALGSGRVWVQCENEVGDASVNPEARYWRGTTAQYVAQLAAFYEAVRSVNPAVPVVLTSFPSEALDAVTDPNDPHHDYQVTRITQLLDTATYDAVDLHFYGCVTDIAAKAEWVTQHLPAGTRWISTENGGPDCRCPTTPLCWSEQSMDVFEQIEASQVPARLGACADNGGSICLWFSLFDLPHETSVFSHLGLLDTSVLPPRHKPAYDTFKSFTTTHQ